MSSRTASEMRLVGLVLATVETLENDRILFMHSTQQMLKDNGLTNEATSNLTRLVQNVKGVETTVYFREEETEQYRLSLRSKTLNVHEIAVKYNGGGHLQASGCFMSGTLAEVKAIIIKEILAAQKLVN